MRKTIIFIFITLLLVSIATSQQRDPEDTRTEFTKNIQTRTISNTNEIKLDRYYSERFQNIDSYNNYQEYNHIIIINVSIGNSYARIITHNKTFMEAIR